MAKNRNTEEVKTDIYATSAPLLPSSVIQTDDPGKSLINEVKLNAGEVLLVSINSDGNETGLPFRVNYNTYRQYYSDDSRFQKKR